MHTISSKATVFKDSKKHYEILDGLRGVAALIVVVFHILEIFSGGDHTKQFINHGYLAVDFFFLLSGFVISHAYDDRWNKLTLKEFFMRRLIRLHPMIIVGMLVGAICFYPSAAAMFPLVAETPVWKMVLVLLVGFTLIPVTPSMDIRGWQEMHPLNGPAWSLFFEYIANIMYALFLRKLSTKMLSILVFIAGIVLLHFAITSEKGDVIGGWSIDPLQLQIGFTRLMYPFLAGMLLRKITTPRNINNAFMWSTVLIVLALAFPRVGGTENLWANGIYDALVILFVFPAIVFIGSSGSIKGEFMQRTCNFLGNISYPIYIVHYPFVYVFYAWVENNNVPLEKAWPVGIVTFITSIVVSYLAMKYYDIPFRKWLSVRLLKK